MTARLAGVGLRDWPAVLLTLAVATVIEVGMRTVRLPTLARWAGVPLAADTPAGEIGGAPGLPTLTEADRQRLRMCVQVMRHWPPDEKCLRMALVSGWLIRHLGPRLVIGVAIVDGIVKAHAWLAVDGRSLDPQGSASYLHLAPVVPG